MAKVEVVMPQMGESITEGTIIKWHKKVGERVKKDETLLEISTDKVDSEIPSPASGVLKEILVNVNETVPVQTVIAHLETEGDDGVADEGKADRDKADLLQKEVEHKEVVSRSEPAEHKKIDKPISRQKESGNKFFSPLVLNIAREEKVAMEELEKMSGSGRGGRVTKKDILGYIEKKKSGDVSPATLDPGSTETGVKRDGVEVIKMDTMRKSIAEHMVKSVHTSPHVSSVTEADLSRITSFRKQNKTAFEKREGFKLTFTPFFVDSVVRALKDFPLVNASVEGDNIIVKKRINIGIAVALDNGLIVPVIKNADEKNLTGLARVVNDLAIRARGKKLLPEEVQDGTFTITNPGVFGNLWGTPIINQPQVAILGVGAIKKRAVIINDAIAVRPMVYISMSYDHRIIDGALGGMFLEKIVGYLENFDTEQAI